MNPIEGPVVLFPDGEEPGWFDAKTHRRIYHENVMCVKCEDEASRVQVVEQGGYWECSCGEAQVLA